MTPATKIMALAAVCLLAIFTLAAQFIVVRERTVQQASYTTNAGELTGDVLIGQTFKSEHNYLSGVAVMFATYSNRANTQPIHFHLRESLEAREDLRRVAIAPHLLGDNQFYRFEFEPIADSEGKNFFFFVVSPSSVPGNAVTVDVDSRNPYHLGTAFIVRGRGRDVTAPQNLAPSGKPTQDLGFASYHTVPLRVAVINAARQAVYSFIVNWDDQRSHYEIVGKTMVPGLLFLLLLIAMSRRSESEGTPAALSRRAVIFLLIFLFVVAVGLRILYARELPVTEDEGNYLYDARSLRQGILAGGDGYVKAPLVIAWMALWQFLLGDTIIAGRLSSIVIGALTIFPIYSLGCQLKNRLTGIMAAAVWSLFGAAVLANVYAHTQPLALFFGIMGLAVLWQAVRQPAFSASPSLSAHGPSNLKLIGAGMLLGLGVISRKSILALGVLPLLFIAVHGVSWRQRLHYCFLVGIGFMLVVGAFLWSAYQVYGLEGLWEALGVNSATDGTISLDPSEAEKTRSYSLRGMTPFFRESLPLIFLSLLGWGLLLETFSRNLVRRALRERPSPFTRALLEHVVPKIVWIFPLAAFWWCWQFFFEYEGSAFMFYGMTLLWYLMGGMLVLVACWPRPQSEQFVFEEKSTIKRSTQPLHHALPNIIGSLKKVTTPPFLSVSANSPVSVSVILLLPVWLGGLIFFYSNWIKFHANYLNEFLPPLAIVAGAGALLMWQRIMSTLSQLENGYPWTVFVTKIISSVTALVLLWSMFLSNYITFLYEHTGTFTQRAAYEAGVWARDNIPLDQPIFTGSSLVAYLSGHHTALDISHPRWYAYEFTRKDPERLNTFLPPVETMLEAYRHTQWFLLDSQTSFSFLMEYSEIEAGLERDFESVKGIENGSNTLTFYRRKNSP
ncbi:MAG: hypothetical protein WEA04_00550 [Candidatus Andersenbacteria bacterium]